MTDRMRRCWTSTIHKGPNRVNGASRPTSPPHSRSRRAGGRSHRSSLTAALSSCRERRITSQRHLRGRLQRDQAARRRRHHHAQRANRRTRPRSGCSGSRARPWRGIALRGPLGSRGLDLWENARLFGLLNLAMADGYIASWEAKYHYSFWRPITAIRLGDTDGNPDTEGSGGLDAPATRPIPCPITTPATRCKAAWRRRS